jgi:hypothetical protein
MPVNLLANLGDLSKPATTLIEKIADAVGGVARPYQIVRIAKAEAKASRIQAEGEIEVKNLQRRALRRFVAEEAKKQANMDQIIRDALPLLEDKSAPENVADDWIANFSENCRIISDEDMQRLWSRILAGEANCPGSYTRRTVNLLSDLEKPDAELFTRLCGFVVSFPDPLTFIFNLNHEVYTHQGINFESLSHLESLSLVRFDSVKWFRRLNLPEQFKRHTLVEPSTSRSLNRPTTLSRLERSCSPVPELSFLALVTALPWRDSSSSSVQNGSVSPISPPLPRQRRNPQPRPQSSTSRGEVVSRRSFSSFGRGFDSHRPTVVISFRCLKQSNSGCFSNMSVLSSRRYPSHSKRGNRRAKRLGRRHRPVAGGVPRRITSAVRRVTLPPVGVRRILLGLGR